MNWNTAPSLPTRHAPASGGPGSTRHSRPARLLAGLSGLAAVALATPVAAQDCKLAVQASPMIVRAGESAQVHVFAHFPASGHAFAEAAFDMTATLPDWTFASAGVLAGASVLGIEVGQDHAPQAGIFANPSNPIRVWAGRLTPDTDAPAFIQVNVQPGSFAYYPSVLTPSSAPCPAAAGEAWILANPLFVGPVAAAPGRDTELEAGPDSFTATTPTQSILIGMLVPAVQKVREAAQRMHFEERPTRLKVQAQVGSKPEVEDTVVIVYGPIDIRYLTGMPEGYGLTLENLPPGTPVEVEVLRQGRRLARTTTTPERLTLAVSRHPDVIGHQVRPLPAAGWGASAYQYAHTATFERSGSRAGGVNVLLGDGSVRMIRDATEVRVSASRPTSSNNLKQIGLGAHSYEAHGARRMVVTPLIPGTQAP